MYHAPILATKLLHYEKYESDPEEPASIILQRSTKVIELY